MKQTFLVLVVAAVATSPAWAQQQPGQLTTKSAIRQAIETGYSEYWAGSSVQHDVNRTLGRPIESSVRIRLKRGKQFNPECARLAMSFYDPSTAPRTELFELQMNVCKDGSPPFEGVDLATPVGPANSSPVPRLGR